MTRKPRKPLTNEQRIEIYTELQRRVSVGAYLELEHDGSFPPDDGTPESTTLESLHNLESWAEKQGLEFCWHRDTQTWSLEPIEPWRQDSVDAAIHKRHQFQAMQEEAKQDYDPAIMDERHPFYQPESEV